MSARGFAVVIRFVFLFANATDRVVLFVYVIYDTDIFQVGSTDLLLLNVPHKLFWTV